MCLDLLKQQWHSPRGQRVENIRMDPRANSVSAGLLRRYQENPEGMCFKSPKGKSQGPNTKLMQFWSYNLWLRISNTNEEKTFQRSFQRYISWSVSLLVSHSVLPNFFVTLWTAPLSMLLQVSCITSKFMAEPLGKSLSSMGCCVKDNFIWKNILIFGLRSIFFCLIIHPLLTSLVLKIKPMLLG